MPTLLPAHKAALSETLAADLIHLQTDGHVHIAQPVPDDHAVDRRAYVPGARATLEVQAKSAYTERRPGVWEFRVDADAIPRDASRYVVLCVLGTERPPGLADAMWLIPGAVIRRKAKGRPQYVFEVSPHGPRPTQWDRYQVRREDLGKEVLARLRAFEEEEEGRRLPAKRGGISRIARGLIVEHAVTFELIMGSDGRLTVFRPFADTAGLDLDILAIDSCVSAGAQVKGEFVEDLRDQVTILVREETFRARGDRYIVFAPYLPGERTLAPVVWVLRADVFARLAGRTRGKLVFAATPQGGRKGERWAPYRYRPEELAGLFERVIAVCAVGRVKELPDTGR